MTEASFVILWNIARAKRPLFGGEFINNKADVAVLDPNNTRLQRQIAQTLVSAALQRGISLRSVLMLHAKFPFDESTAIQGESFDIQDNPQLADFVYLEVTVKEEMLNLMELKETTCATVRALTNAGVSLYRLVSVATDGAPAMVVVVMKVEE
ncbi:uncharacterized protein LOC106880820 [Octopus bimaculoides]|uniref:uncharacterized protein LOC106880820 n=1 Tax=Octopus bimaculoides TaxID=37653 RepID=UPI00071DDBE4|nr:uncharacterized protein LOC106880820 [Octopus bimaculoides]|eukprot:XP_014786433.1 PREDICTED: uncharacterized protein LOC106880820 [Octopus bimaculoides]